MPVAGVAEGRLGLRRALLTLAAAGLLLGVVVAYAIATSRHTDHRGLEATIALVIGWGFVGTGLYAWWRRPENRFGLLMTVAGFLFFVSELGSANSSLVFTVATLCGNLFLAVVVHMLLAMPSGRLRTRGERVFVVGMYVFASPLSRVYVLLADPRDFGCDGCPPSSWLIADDPDFAHSWDTVVNWVALVMFLLAAAFLWRHWHQANRAERRVLGPVLVTGLTIMALLEVGLIGQLAGHATIAELGYYATQAAILPLPYAFMASLARSRVTRGDAISELMASLAQAPVAGGDPRRARARPRRPGARARVLAAGVRDLRRRGRPVGRPRPPRRGPEPRTLIGRNGGRVGALVHDALLLEEQRLLDAAAGAAAISLENVRLNVELRARLEELRASRSRIVEAGDAERRRLERNLHDGAQQRLVAVALQLRLLRNRIDGDETAQELAASAAEELTRSLDELRELARGLHPAVLEQGLEAALQALATRSSVATTVSFASPGRLPQPVELAAYFVACEALANVAKYADAGAVSVRVWRDGPAALIEIADDGVGGADDHRGTGLRGLADRVEALDGACASSARPARGPS